MNRRFLDGCTWGAVLALLGLWLTGCDRLLGPIGPGNSNGSAPTLRIETVTPTRRTIRQTLELPGRIDAFESTAIHAKIGGYVKSWSANIGDRVKKGQVLAILEVPEAVAEVEQKRAAIDQAKARRDQAEAAVKVARAEVQTAEAKIVEARAGVRRAKSDVSRWQAEVARVEQLFRERAQTGSLLDETRNKLRAAESAEEEVGAQIQSAEAARTQGLAALEKARADSSAAVAGIEVAQADLHHAEALLAYTRIVAPFDGIVSRRDIDTGDLTTPGRQGEPLFVVDRSDLLTLVLGVPERSAPKVKTGASVAIRVDALPGMSLVGKVARTAHALDARSRTLRVEVDLPDPEGLLHPGLYASGAIVLEERRDVLCVPSTALVRVGDTVVCVEVKDGKASRKSVQIGINDDSWTQITSGLSGTEQVVKANAGAVADGQPVESIQPAKSADLCRKP
jgi:RND family efflux transporter MFP subunit